MLGALSHAKVAALRKPAVASKTASAAVRPVCMASSQQGPVELDRRTSLLSLAAAVAAMAAGPSPALAKSGTTRKAGDFLPNASTPGYVVYTPDNRATPSIRAGVISPESGFYSFDLPATWSEGTILNILSGNFCMPKCDEPWVEALWESSEGGSAKLVVSPLYRLISKGNATLKDLGAPDQVVDRVGAFITGNYLDSIEDVVVMNTEQFADGRTYYTYEVVAPYGKDGQHFLAALTIKGDLVYLWVTQSSEKQWAKNESTLRHMLNSFKA